MRVERGTYIAKAPADVFDVISDVRNDPKWHTDVLEVTSSSDVVGLGTVFNVRIKPSMGISEGTIEVTRFEPGRLVELTGKMGKINPTVTNVCETDGNGTRVIRRVEIEPPGLMRLMSPMISRTIAKANDGFLANLKRLLESG